MNVLLNNYYNINREYCFVNHILEKGNINIPLSNFDKIIIYSNNALVVAFKTKKMWIFTF